MADDDQDDYWQPGQPWKPRTGNDGSARQVPTPPPHTPVTPPAPAEPPVQPVPPASGTGYVATDEWPRVPPPHSPAGHGLRAEPGQQVEAPSPNARPDATVMMPIIPPPASRPAASPPPGSPPPGSRSAVPQPAASRPPTATPPVSPRRGQEPARRPKRRSRFLRRLALLVTILGLVVAAGAVWAESLLEQVETPSLAGGPGPETYLIVGSDSRENLPDDLDGSFGDFGGQRADVIILAHVSGGTVQMLSLPRDLKVDIPGRGTDKINAAFAYGGGDLLAQTVQQDLGIPISRYMEVEFGGFAEIVDSVGGVELTFEYPTRDTKSGLEVDAGTQIVDGATALAYVRSRSTEELRDGDWRDADGGDIARTGRQREVLEGIIGRAVTPGGLIRLPSLVPSVTSSIRVGDSTHSWNLGLFAVRFATASANESMAIPVAGATEGGVSYVVRTEDAAPVIRAFVAGEPLPVEDQG
jgi:LCP family protein required for cell wall assembly